MTYHEQYILSIIITAPEEFQGELKILDQWVSQHLAKKI